MRNLVRGATNISSIGIIMFLISMIFVFFPPTTYSEGAPKFIEINYIELSKIQRISKFRSGTGHDYSDNFESCRSMKHYFKPYANVDWSTINVYSPLDGKVDSIFQEWAGTQLWIKSSLFSSFTIIIFHINTISTFAVGESIKAGQKLGTLVGSMTMLDIAVIYRTAKVWKLMSYFEVMTDDLFQSYIDRGIPSQDLLIISKFPSRNGYFPQSRRQSAGFLVRRTPVRLRVIP